MSCDAEERGANQKEVGLKLTLHASFHPWVEMGPFSCRVFHLKIPGSSSVRCPKGSL